MIAIYIIISILSIIAITSIYIIYKEYKAIRIVLEEAKSVKTDLEDYMERCIKLSNEIVLQLNKPIDNDHISMQELNQADNHINIENKEEEEKPQEKILINTKKEDKKNKKIDLYKEEINELVEESRKNNNQEYSAKKIYEILSDKYPDTFNVSYRTVAYYVSELKKTTLKKANKNDKNQITYSNELKIVKKPITSEEKKEDNIFIKKENKSKLNNIREIKIEKEYINNTHPYEIVENLYEKGHSIRQIAQIMGKGQGEIGLILNLQKKKVALKYPG